MPLGVTRDVVAGWVARGNLEATQRGVYRQPGVVVPPGQHVRAAVYRAGQGARATGWSACALFGIEGFGIGEQAWIVVPCRRRVRGADFIVERRELGPEDLATVGGIAAVTPYRALIDVAGRAEPKAVRVAIDDARRKKLVDLDRLVARAHELGQHRGATALRWLHGSGALAQESELERQLALLLAEHDLWPAWGMEVLPGIIADACFPDASYIVECDGGQWHTIEADRAADATRTGVLRADGWRVDRFTDDDLTNRPGEVVSTIKANRCARVEAGLGRHAEWRPVHPGRRVRPPS